MSDLERTCTRFMHLPDAKVPCSITLSVPKGKSEMRIHSCPSCGAQLDFIAVRGQVVNCQFCKSTFEIE
ncbi:MAG: hypothetical protein V3U09_08175 [Thermoplasmata archaeon]